MSEFDLGALGWNPELAEQLEPGLVPGRVVAAHRAAYDVADGRRRRPHPAARTAAARERRCRGRRLGRARRRADPHGAAAAERDRPAGRGPDVRAADARGERRRRVRRHVARPGARAAPHRALPRHDLGERRGAGDRADEGRPGRGSVGAGRRGRGGRDRRAGARRQRVDGSGLRRAARASRRRA